MVAWRLRGGLSTHWLMGWITCTAGEGCRSAEAAACCSQGGEAWPFFSACARTLTAASCDCRPLRWVRVKVMGARRAQAEAMLLQDRGCAHPEIYEGSRSVHAGLREL